MARPLDDARKRAANDSVSDYIETVRTRLVMTRAEFAFELGVCLNTLGNWTYDTRAIPAWVIPVVRGLMLARGVDPENVRVPVGGL